jgi:glutathione synthase/RimK-type ligase-like ATP-grasp enzyme
LAGRIPEIHTKKVIVFLFFPFYYWNEYIEHKNYKGIYGNLVFFKKFIKFCERLDKIIKNALSKKEFLFINNPISCALYRDKLEIKKKLSGANIPQPKLYNVTCVKEVQKWLNKGRNLFAKVRCGSMGKGITFLSWSDWQTNFIFRNNKIISKRSDRGWKFREITGNIAFLRQLIKKDIFIEEAVDMLILNKMKVDLRIYTFFNKVLYIYPRRNCSDRVTTNITQGGKGDPSLLEILPKHLLLKARKIAEKTSRVLGFNFAGIDVIMNRNLNGVYIVDVNAFPGFPKRRTFNLTQHMVKELVRLLNKRGLHFERGCDI